MKRSRSLPLLTTFAVCAWGISGCKPPKQAVVAPPPTPKDPVEEPVVPPPPPPPYVPAKTLQTGTIFNGMQFKANLETEEGNTATADRNEPGSYSVEVNVKVRVPKPHSELSELMKLNDRLPVLLPGLESALTNAKVSQAFDEIYRAKVNAVRTSLNRLDVFPTRHNFYDCETILELQHPGSQRRVLLLQADMDVDTDGSDGDRASSVDVDSKTFQPFTSYYWPKATPTPNPFVAVWEKRVRDFESKLTDVKTSAAEIQRIKAETLRLQSEVKDMQKNSYLVGALDPFIVLPLSMVRGKTPFTPKIGDYCVVIAESTIYPAIIGDAGPLGKVGEASVKLCKQINPMSHGGFRPMSDLKATYLIFPGTADRPWGVPDPAKWRARCEQLLNEFGGFRGELFTWPPLVTLPAPVEVTSTPATPAATAPVVGVAAPLPAPKQNNSAENAVSAPKNGQ